MQNEDILTIPTENVRPKANKKVKFIIGGLLIVVAVAYLIYTGIQSSSAYYLTIDELHAKSATMVNRQVRVAGLVDTPSVDYNHKELILKFDIVSETGARLTIVFNGPKPDQINSEGAEAIVEGEFDGEVFQAKSLLLKCPSRYEDGEQEIQQVEAIN